MIRLFFSCFALSCLATLGLQAQDTPLVNADFEQWDTIRATTTGEILYFNPAGPWTTNNLVSTLNADTPPFVAPETARVHSGSFAIRNQSGTLGTLPVGALTGIGDFELDFVDQFNSYKPGTPFTGRPDYLRGHFIYEPVDGDGCDIYVVLQNNCNAENQCDTLGAGIFTTFETVSDYQEILIPISYTSDAQPERMFVVFAASRAAAPPAYIAGNGTLLIVDDFEFVYGDPNGVAIPIMSEYAVEVFPNPATDYLTVDRADSELLQLRLFNFEGRELARHELSSASERIPIGNLPAAGYLFQLVDDQERVVAGGRFMVE